MPMMPPRLFRCRHFRRRVPPLLLRASFAADAYIFSLYGLIRCTPLFSLIDDAMPLFFFMPLLCVMSIIMMLRHYTPPLEMPAIFRADVALLHAMPLAAAMLSLLMPLLMLIFAADAG